MFDIDGAIARELCNMASEAYPIINHIVIPNTDEPTTYESGYNPLPQMMLVSRSEATVTGASKISCMLRCGRCRSVKRFVALLPSSQSDHQITTLC